MYPEHSGYSQEDDSANSSQFIRIVGASEHNKEKSVRKENQFIRVFDPTENTEPNYMAA